jgi:hypothetical protein
VTTQDAARAQADPAANAVRANGLFGVLRATGRITTAALQPQHRLQRGKNDPISADEKDEQRRHGRISMAKFQKKATRLEQRRCLEERLNSQETAKRPIHPLKSYPPKA